MYVPRYQKGEILRFPYPRNKSARFDTVVVSNSYIIGIAFDSLNAHLYWAEVHTGKIMRCNSDGSELTNIRNETYPSVLTIDIDNRLIYYGQEKSNGQLHRITVDGKDHRVLVNSTYNVYGIDIDVTDKRLYWMESSTGGLKSAWYNGSDVKTIVKYVFWNFAINQDLIFYSSGTTIWKINKSLGQIPTVVHSGTENVYAILIYEHDGCNYFVSS